MIEAPCQPILGAQFVEQFVGRTAKVLFDTAPIKIYALSANGVSLDFPDFDQTINSGDQITLIGSGSYFQHYRLYAGVIIRLGQQERMHLLLNADIHDQQIQICLE